jgi:pimeloyl-ACP methyl ester carboxylesterase
MAVNFLASQEKLACDAVVLIGLPTFSSELPEANSGDLIKKITIPTLDIFGSQDLDNVKKLAPTRRLTLAKNNPFNRQIEISGADHTFTGLNDTLVRSIHNWLIHVFKKPENP